MPLKELTPQMSSFGGFFGSFFAHLREGVDTMKIYYREKKDGESEMIRIIKSGKKVHKEILTVKDFASYMGVSGKVAYEIVNSRDFPKFKIGKSIKIPNVELQAWIKERVKKEMEES